MTCRNHIRSYLTYRGAIISFVTLLILSFALAGCNHLPHKEVVRYVTTKPKKEKEALWRIWLKNSYLYHGRDMLNLPYLLRTLISGPIPAEDVLPDGTVPDSSFYTNRDISKMTLEEIQKGPNQYDELKGNITILKKKKRRVCPGFIGKDERGDKYLFKFYPDEATELSTAAEVIGCKILYALGYNVPGNYIVTVKGTGNKKYDGRRAVASRFIKGEILGQFKFDKFKNRREFRALKIASAWINDTDMADHNTLVTWRNGIAWYYLIDFDNSLGGHTTKPKSPKHGWENTFDLGAGIIHLFTLGLIKPPYDKNAKPFSKAVGLFNANFDPDRWKTYYPNMAFERITRDDAVWMAKKIAQFTDDKIRAAVKAGKYSRKEDEDYVVKILAERRDIILRTYGVKKVAEPNH